MVPMKVISLQSGSNGNCIYVEADGVKLLIDAGISGIQTSPSKPTARFSGRNCPCF
jgi:predicted metallo-beta-lactamase superfamily hydrolase